MANFAKSKIGWISLVLIVLVSCVTVYDTINNRDYSKKYNPGRNQLHPNFRIYQYSANELRLYFQFYPQEFAFTVAESDSVARAFASLFFRVTKTYNSIEIIDSLTSNFSFKGKPRAQFTGFVPISLPNDDEYVLEVFLTDQVTQATVSQVMQIKKPLSGSEHSFMLTSAHNNPRFSNFLSIDDTIRLRSDMFHNQEIQVQKIIKDTTLPLPPDVTRNFIEYESLVNDSAWSITRIDTTLIDLPNEGIYVFSDNGIKVNKAIGVFNAWYPHVKTPEELLRPLAYLNSPREMEKLWALGNPKQAVDSFWINATNDLGKARELIRIYYNRVQLANYFFTSIKEGWRTDRGMVYITFGIPSTVIIDKEGETWIYGKGSDGDLNLFFYREQHPIFGEYYYLSRSDQYSRIWFNATSTWRSGRVFSIN